MKAKEQLKKFLWECKILRKKIKLFFSHTICRLVIICLPARKNKFDLEKVKKILIARNDKIGDMVVTTAIIKTLALAGFDVYVSSNASSLSILKNNPYVKDVFEYDERSLFKLYKNIKKIRKHHFDLVIDVRPFYSFEMRKIIFCAFMNSTNLMGFNKSSIKSYNISISYYDKESHITNQLNMILNYLNIANYDTNYDLHVGNENEQYVLDFLKEKNVVSKFVVVNPFGGARKRELSEWQINYIVSLLTVKMPNHAIIFIGEKNKIGSINENLGLKFQSGSILDVVSLIKRAVYVVTVDTSIVHITTAYHLPCLTIYSETKLSDNTNNIDIMMRRKWTEYYRSECNKVIDNNYLKSNHLSIELPSCYAEIWAPNNGYAKQTIFYKSFISKVSENEFKSKISDCF